MGKTLGKEKIALLLILLSGVALRLININQSLWLDEAAQAVLSNKSIDFIWYGREGDFHPPLFYLISHVWIQFSHEEWWLRTLPVIFGSTNIIYLYFFAKNIFLKKYQYAGIVSAFLLAIAPFHIYYSQEFRSYSALCLLGTVSMHVFYRKKYILLGIVNALLIYTHYAGFFLIACQCLYQIAYDKKNILNLLKSIAISIIIFLPWLPQFIKQLYSGVSINEYLPGWKNILSISPIKAFPTILFKVIAGRINIFPRFVYGLYIISVLLIIFAATLAANIEKRFLMLWMFGPIGMIMAISLVLPQSQPFRIIYILPAFLLIFTSAISRYPKVFLTLCIYISLVGNLLYFTRPRLQREQWLQAAEYLQNKNLPTLVKFSDSFAPLQWYAPNLPVVPVIKKFPANKQEVEGNIQQTLISENHIVVLNYLSDLTDPNDNVEFILKKYGYQKSEEINFEGVGIITQYYISR